MTGHPRARFGKPIQPMHSAVWIPPPQIEYAYYFVIFYSLMSDFLGVEVPLVASGITVALAGFCYRRLGSRAKEVCAPIKLLLACQISFILIQIVVHGASPTEDYIREFVLWICGMIIVQSLRLRKGFLLRCTVVLFALGLVTVPYLAFRQDVVERAAVAIKVSGNLTNSNGLAGWFGFCAIAFTLYGLETGSIVGRILYAGVATVSLIIVGFTVSRAALLGIALALTVAFRRLLKRGFAPLLLLLIITGVVFEAGLLETIAGRYEERATDETGREIIWPAVIERYSTSPLVGVGASERMTDVKGQEAAPHNSFLYFALTSGVIPFALWVAFWLRAAGTPFSRAARLKPNPFQLPFLIYVATVFLFGDITAAPWVLLTLSVGAGPLPFHQSHRALIPQGIRGRKTAPSLRTSFKASALK